MENKVFVLRVLKAFSWKCIWEKRKKKKKGEKEQLNFKAIHLLAWEFHIKIWTQRSQKKFSVEIYTTNFCSIHCIPVFSQIPQVPVPKFPHTSVHCCQGFHVLTWKPANLETVIRKLPKINNKNNCRETLLVSITKQSWEWETLQCSASL